MTHDQLQAIHDDLAFMRGLAEEGRRAPLLGGSVLVGAGTSFGLASLLHWILMRGDLGDAPWLGPAIWLTAMAAFLAVLFWSKRRLRDRTGAQAAANRATTAAWSGAASAIFALFAAFMLASMLTGEWIIMSLLGPVYLALYGAAWSVAAAMSDRGWIKGVAVASLLSSVGVAALAGRADQYLAYALALVVVALLPGLALMRQAPSDVI